MSYPQDYKKELEEELGNLAKSQDSIPFVSYYKVERIKHLRQRVGIPVVLLDAKEIAVGDYSPEYGTVKSVTTRNDMVSIEFVNGVKVDVSEETEMEIDQGGRFDHYRDRVTTEKVTS